MDIETVITFVGAICFGFVIGWVTYRTLRLNQDKVGLADIASIIGALGGAIITGIFSGLLFAGYAIGLLAGFLTYFGIARKLMGDSGVIPWMGGGGTPVNRPGTVKKNG